MKQRPKNRRTNQPQYGALHRKMLARQENLGIYRELTGLTSLPADRSYWTLCNWQDPSKEGTEIVQLENEEFLTKNQFHGVDWNKKIIKQNKVWHPEANWYHGEWLQIIREQDDFNPALIYLDATCFADRKIILNAVAATMPLCPLGTVLLVNAMRNDPRSKAILSTKKLVANLGKVVGSFELEKWSGEVKSFNYNASGKTNMITFAFHKKGIIN